MVGVYANAVSVTPKGFQRELRRRTVAAYAATRHVDRLTADVEHTNRYHTTYISSGPALQLTIRLVYLGVHSTGCFEKSSSPKKIVDNM